MRREAVAGLCGEHSVRAACRALGISRSSYYESEQRLAKRKVAEEPIVRDIKEVQKHRYKRYFGSPRMMGALRERGHNIGRHQTARIMRKYNLPAAKRHRFVRTTDSKHSHPVAENLLNRSFKAGQEERVWCADITYLRTLYGWMYLAVVLDLRTRKWVGFAVASHMRAELVDVALGMALLQEGEVPQMMHSDRGVQYASEQHRDLLDEYDITLSMSRKGNCWDNAVVESFNGTFKNEVGDTFVDEDDVRSSVFDYHCFYNRERPHSSLGYRSPQQFCDELDAGTPTARGAGHKVAA